MEKIHRITALLEEAFGCKMVSHRAGRWGLDRRYAGRTLEEFHGEFRRRIVR